MTFSDLEGLSKIFNDMKHRTISLRQLSFLLIRECTHVCSFPSVLIFSSRSCMPQRD